MDDQEVKEHQAKWDTYTDEEKYELCERLVKEACA